jgi:hypothetical protein
LQPAHGLQQQSTLRARPKQLQKPQCFKQHLWLRHGSQHEPHPVPQLGSQQLPHSQPQAGSQQFPQPQLWQQSLQGPVHGQIGT